MVVSETFTGSIPSLTEYKALCHCFHCKKISGSAFSTNLRVPLDHLKIEGETKVYTERKTTGTGLPADIYFCKNCCAPLYVASSSQPGIASVKAGILDGDGFNKYVPTAEANLKERATWLTPQEGTTTFERMPPGYPTKDS